MASDRVRLTKGSVFVEGVHNGNATVGLTHSKEVRGDGLVRGPWGDVEIERADIPDLIECLVIFSASARWHQLERMAALQGVKLEWL